MLSSLYRLINYSDIVVKKMAKKSRVEKLRNLRLSWKRNIDIMSKSFYLWKYTLVFKFDSY
jgi:hypothetical protein